MVVDETIGEVVDRIDSGPGRRRALPVRKRGEAPARVGGLSGSAHVEDGAAPWDDWYARARAAGVAEELAELGRQVMREAHQHVWDWPRQEECGWADGGEAMIARALAEPDAARARWQWLLDMDGAEGE